VIVTVVEAEVVPAGPVAVAVYVVVAVGVTLTDPVAANVPSPFRVTEVALLALHCNTDEDPLAMLPG
jgi:hypothetical protein